MRRVYSILNVYRTECWSLTCFNIVLFIVWFQGQIVYIFTITYTYQHNDDVQSTFVSDQLFMFSKEYDTLSQSS